MAVLPGNVRLKGDAPTWKEKRDLLADPAAPAAALAAVAGMLEAAGQCEEAAAFFHRAGDTAAVERLRKRGVESGDSFLWLSACRLLGALPFPADEGRALAAVAEGRGKLFDARSALAAIEDADAVAQVEARIPTALPVKPVEQEVADAVEEFEATHPGAGDGEESGPGDEGSQGVAKIGG
jgi:hypothetical protein